MTAMKAVRLFIGGRVQGVGYRAWFAAEARRRGLRGWVRNRREGTVEAQLRGETDVIDAMVAAAHRGPPAARVDRIEVSEAPDDGGDGFEVWPTV